LTEERRRRKRKKGRNIIPLLIEGMVACLLVVLVVKVASVSFNFAKDYFGGEEVSNKTGEYVELTIPAGASTEDIANILEEKGLIDNTLVFRLVSRMDGYDGTYMQGDYRIEKGTGNEEIMQILQSGVVYAESEKLTIPEGYTAKQIAAAVEEAGFATAEEFIEEMNTGEFEYEFLENLPDREFRLEGYLFPATYEIAEGADAHDIIVLMLDRFELAYDKYLSSYYGDYTIDELVTVASLIESEIQVDEERRTAAGVIYNRLEIDMPLQIDSTVQYAHSTRNEVVTYADLEIDSPYNTYKYYGLPLGPISCPGEPSLEAAANPEINEYLYYVLRERGSGEHVYCKTYDEFLAAKAKYQNSFN